MEPTDPASSRDHLANERTHLAWLRTAANVMVLGLAVARFGDGGHMTLSSLCAGGVLVVTGVGGVAYGSARYRSTARDLVNGSLDTVGRTTGPLVAAAVLVVALLLAVVVDLL
jgi:uncharacterized membrane protein YidH (DUF202 family)